MVAVAVLATLRWRWRWARPSQPRRPFRLCGQPSQCRRRLGEALWACGVWACSRALVAGFALLRRRRGRGRRRLAMQIQPSQSYRLCSRPSQSRQTLVWVLWVCQGWLRGPSHSGRGGRRGRVP
jgi:hypothetical protein